jgi:hypothetical protein
VRLNLSALFSTDRATSGRNSFCAGMVRVNPGT